jgi:hypothetical protein
MGAAAGEPGGATGPGRAFLIFWPPAQLGSLPAPVALSRPSLPGDAQTPVGRARVAALRGRR